jgi:hypothetical protein
MKKPSVTFGSRQPQSLRHWRPVSECCAVMITAASLGIEPAALCKGFEKRGLAAAVFTNKERDLAPKRDIDPV